MLSLPSLFLLAMKNDTSKNTDKIWIQISKFRYFGSRALGWNDE